MAKMKTEFNLKQDETTTLNALSPIISIIGTGRETYIWVGNNHEFNKSCYATMSGQKKLETFAMNILKSLGSKKLKP